MTFDSRICIRVLCITLMAAGLTSVAVAQKTDGTPDQYTLETLDAELDALWAASRYEDAVPVAERWNSLAEQQLGADDPYTLNTLRVLARHLQYSGDFGRAETLYERALAGHIRHLGEDHPDTLYTISNMADLYRLTGRYALAEEYYLRALAGQRSVLGENHQDTAVTLGNLGGLYFETNRYEEALQLELLTAQLFEDALGGDHPDVINAKIALSQSYSHFGEYGRSLELAREAVDTATLSFPAGHPSLNAARDALGVALADVGEYEAAEPHIRVALTASQLHFGSAHVDTISIRQTLVWILESTGRSAEAFEESARILADTRSLFGDNHPDSLLAAVNHRRRAWFNGHDKATEREALERLVDQISASAKTRPTDLAHALAILAELDTELGLFDLAEQRYLRAIDVALGVDATQEVLFARAGLGSAYFATGQHAQANEEYSEVLRAEIARLGFEHPETQTSYFNYIANRAAHVQASQDPLGALLLGSLPRSIRDNHASALDEYSLRYRDTLVPPEAADNPAHPATIAQTLLGSTLYAIFARDFRPTDEGITHPAFALAQAYHFSTAANALRSSTAALTVDDPELRALVDAANNTSAELEAAEAALAVLLARPIADQNPSALNYARSRVNQALDALSAASNALRAADVNLADLAVARTSSVREVQSVLSNDEALLFYSRGADADAAMAFVVTPTMAAAIPLMFSLEGMSSTIASVRVGLELDPGEDYRLTDADLRAQAFNMETAKALHDEIFAPVREYLGSARRIMVVADGPLQTIPLHVLVSELPADEIEGFARYREATWLAEEFAFARLPSVSALLALRREATPPPGGGRELIGFGDPVLTGYDDAPARSSPGSEVFFQVLNASGATQIDDLPALRQTGDLLREVQATLDLPDEDIYLGPRAVEAALVRLNTGGRLLDYRSLAFATHALINDEIEGLDEPAIVLTPTDDSDGLLRASEVVQLDLDAGLVILAACNTAAADGSPGAEALSGLAKAFYYAGARALLVSNWPAEAGATAELVPDLVQGIEEEGLPRSVALQRAMNTLRDDHRFDFYAHPALWAPFMVAADG